MYYECIFYIKIIYLYYLYIYIMFKIKIKLESLLYNNDKEALNYLKYQNINIDEYDKEIEKKIVNEIELNVRADYSIDYLLKKLSKNLMDKIDVNEQKNKKIKTCVYCFADRDLENPENKNEIIIIDKNIKISKIQNQIDIDNIDIDQEDVSEIEFNDDELSDIDYDELSDIDYDELSDIDYGGGQNGNKILLCKNCKKVYFFHKYFDWKTYTGDYKNYRGIFPFPELIYLRNNENKISFNLIDNQRKEIPYIYNEKSILSPYDNIKNINMAFFKQIYL